MSPRHLPRFVVGAWFVGLLIGSAPAYGQDSARVESIRALMRADKLYEAETGARALVADTSAATGVESLETARAIDLLVEAFLRLRKGAQPEARQLAERALRIKQTLLAADDLEIASSLVNLGQVHSELEDYPAAKSHYEQALRIRRSALDPNDPAIAGVLLRLGRTESDLGHYPDARQLYEAALQIMVAARGESHPEVASILYNLANLLRDIGEYDASLAHYQRALTITQNAEGQQSVHVAYLLDRLAHLHQLMGDYAAAGLLFDQSLQIRERTFGSDHTEVASSLNNLALLRQDLGEYGEARSLHERALDIRLRRLGPDNLLTAQSLDNLAVLMAETGESAEAEPLSRRALSIRRRVLGSAHPQVGTSLHRLAELLERLGEYDEARALYQEALEIWRASVGTSHNDYTRTHGSLAGLLASMGDAPGARSLYEEALAVSERTGNGDHPDTAMVLEGLGDLLMATEDKAGALKAHERALEIRLKSFGPDHPLVAETLTHKAALLGQTGQESAAFDTALRAEAISREHARLTIRSLPERQALRYASMRPPARDLVLTLGAGGGRLDSLRAGKAWDAVIRSRAMVLDEMADRHRSLAKDPGRLEQLIKSRQRLANLIVRGPSHEPLQQYTRLLEDTRKQVETTERAVAEASTDAARAGQRGEIGLVEVTRALPHNAAIIAYVKFQNHDFSTKPAASKATSVGVTASGMVAPVAIYAAFVMTGQSKEVRVVTLGPVDEIDGLATSWQRLVTRAPSPDPKLGQEDLASCRLAGEKLRRRIWDPVAAMVTGSRRVIIVPDGTLHLVSFAALPTGAEQYLIDNGPFIHYLSAERDLVPSRWAKTPGRGTLALGGPSFDTQPLVPSSPAAGAAPGGAALNGAPVRPLARNSGPDCSDFQSVRFAPLPAAVREVDEIATLMRGGAGSPGASPRDDGGVEELTGVDASEAAFKSKAPGRRVLHVATHGFFLGGECSATQPASRGIGGVTPSPRANPSMRAGVNPLLLSGLALAGANMRASADPNAEDGVLTADEIAVMDLSSADWVVLSACDTGMGEIAVDEGILGLRRAFQIASGSALVMSLWSVEDEVARHYMKALYEARFLRGLATDQSVKEASQAILKQLRKQGRGSHPFYWGSFVATGAWR